jgi:NAD(P)-dependent dehydrogenase (short-subunit alcohol dehydrogenase family)
MARASTRSLPNLCALLSGRTLPMPRIFGAAHMVHYPASKAGVVSITRRAAQVLASYGITSNCICPGAVDTPMWRKIDAEWSKLEGWKVGEAWKRRTAFIPLGRPETAEERAIRASQRGTSGPNSVPQISGRLVLRRPRIS